MFENQQLGQVKYIQVTKGQRRYLIEDFKNLSGCYVFATKKKTEALMFEISFDHYSFESFENNNYIRFEDGFPIDDYYSFKIIKPEQIVSIPYNFNTVSSITPEALNSNFESLKETLKKLQESYNNQIVKIDSDFATVMLPNLNDDEVWVRKGNTYRGFQIGDLETNIKQLIEDFKELSQTTFEELELKKDEYVSELESVKNGQQSILEGFLNLSIERIQQEGSSQISLIKYTGSEESSKLNNYGDFQHDRLNKLISDTSIDTKLILMNQMFDIITGSNRYLNGQGLEFRTILFLDRNPDGKTLSTRTDLRSEYNGGSLSARVVKV